MWPYPTTGCSIYSDLSEESVRIENNALVIGSKAALDKYCLEKGGIGHYPVWIDCSLDLLKKIYDIIERIKLYDIPVCLRDEIHFTFYKNIILTCIKLISEKEKYALIDAIADNSTARKELEMYWNESNLLYILSHLLNISSWNVVLCLGILLGIHPEYCFHLFPPSYLSVERIDKNKDIFQLNIPKYINISNAVYEKIANVILEDFDGTAIQKSYVYKCGHESMVIHAVRKNTDYDKDIFEIGKVPPFGYLHNRNYFERDNIRATLLFILNTLTFCDLGLIYTNLPNIKSYNIVPTGVCGGNKCIDAIDYKDVFGHNVVIVCNPSQDEWVKIQDVANKCERNGASSVNFYPYVIDGKYGGYGNNPMPLKTKSILADNILNIKDNNIIPSQQFINIVTDSIPIGKLEEWKQESGLSKIEKSDISKDKFIAKSLKDMMTAPLKPLYKPYSIEAFFKAGVTLGYAPSGAGKTWLYISGAMAAASGRSWLGFGSSDPMRIVYADCEVGESRFYQRIARLRTDYTDQDNEFLDSNFKYISGDYLRSLVNDPKEAEEFFEETPCDVFFFDNINAASRKWTQNPEAFKQFCNLASRFGVNMVVIHHTNKRGEVGGSKMLIDMSQNVIRSDNVRKRTKAECQKRLKIAQILESRWMSYNEETRNRLTAQIRARVPFICVTLEECKEDAPDWEGLSKYLILPKSGDWEELTQWIDLDEDEDAGCDIGQTRHTTVLNVAASIENVGTEEADGETPKGSQVAPDKSADEVSNEASKGADNLSPHNNDSVSDIGNQEQEESADDMAGEEPGLCNQAQEPMVDEAGTLTPRAKRTLDAILDLPEFFTPEQLGEKLGLNIQQDSVQKNYIRPLVRLRYLKKTGTTKGTFYSLVPGMWPPAQN